MSADLGLQTYVVNLKRRQDRRERITRQLPAELTVEFTSDWDGPFDGAALDGEVLRALGVGLFPWRIESNNPWWNRTLKYGEVGCTLSHLACWKRGLETDAPLFMIVEDDVRLVDGFLPRLLEGIEAVRENGEIGLTYLARCPMEPDQLAWPGFVRPGFSYCTWGYLLDRETARQLVDAQVEMAVIPVDEFLPAMYLDHPRPDVRTRFPRRIEALAFAPPLLADPSDELSDSDTETSADAWVLT
ncbi:glycosyltransferase family 25 protein [Streptosporangium sp. NPDC006007]|uniref:glycosyltransferase family 25 protein n=1 Tax=Streptosporangium sp. NPDC006007 TaxID=3154575 RepID=UPI0033B1969A